MILIRIYLHPPSVAVFSLFNDFIKRIVCEVGKAINFFKWNDLGRFIAHMHERSTANARMGGKSGHGKKPVWIGGKFLPDLFNQNPSGNSLGSFLPFRAACVRLLEEGGF